MAVGSSDSSYPAVAKAEVVGQRVKFFYALNVDPGKRLRMPVV